MRNRLLAIAVLTSLLSLVSQLSTAHAQAPFGNALSLDGVNQHVTVPTAAASAVNSPLTVESWVYLRSHANWSRLMDFGNGPGINNIVCALSSGLTGQPALYFFNESGVIIGSVTSPTTLPLNTWTHLAFTYDGTNGSIFINGSSVASAAMPVPPSATRTNNFIGRSNYGADSYANAMIDEFRIWSVARSQSQIQTGMIAPLAGNEPGLVLYYRFDGTNATAANSATATGAAYDGTFQPNTEFSPGARTVGDPYLPDLGNGGYDVQHYDLTINYNPASNTMVSSAAITIRATQGLSEFSLDLRGFPNATAAIDGIAAGVSRLGDKLIITPVSGIVSNRVFVAVVNYSGTPSLIVDPDGTPEGWVPMTNGAFVVCEPMGSMGWFPNNNTPSDKATYDIHITAPNTHVALGNGELASKVNHGDGTSTWNWHMAFPMVSYLATATVGLFDYTHNVSATTTGASGNPLEIYNAIQSTLSLSDKNITSNNATFQDSIIQFFADDIGTYPFDSTGVVVARLPELNYALETQSKSHFAFAPMDRQTLAHEIAHQWYGDCVSPATWREIWFNEGFATWWTWYWLNLRNGSSTTVEQQFTLNYNSASQPDRWNTPPANLPDATWLFDGFSVYTRPGLMLEAYRQIVGHTTFMAFQRAIFAEHAYGTITTAQFIALAERLAQERSGFDAAYLAKLDAFFQQWLYGVGKPTVIPTTFFLDLRPRLTLRRVSSSQLEISWPSTSAAYSLEETANLNVTSWNPVLEPQVVSNGITKVTIVPPSGNLYFRLRKN